MTSTNADYYHYLRDFFELIVENAKKFEDASELDSFELGRKYAYYELLSLAQQQCDAFQLDRVELGLDSIDPENDVLR